MKGNYYLFSPMVDEKGDAVAKIPEPREEFYDDGEQPIMAMFQHSKNKPILTMKKFDNIKDLKEYINGEEVEGK